MPVADTEFLFALSSGDAKHKIVRAILQKKRRELLVPQIALFELIIVLLSEGKKAESAIKAVRTVEAILRGYGLEMLPFDAEQLVRGLEIYRDYKRGFFDSLIAGCALAHDGIVLGDDDHFMGISGLERKTFKQYLAES